MSSEFGSLPPIGAPDAAQLQHFTDLAARTAKRRKLVIFLYPTVKNLRNKPAWAGAIAGTEELCKTTGAECLDVAQEPGWSEKAYASDGVHLTVDGNKLLASILAKAVR